MYSSPWFQGIWISESKEEAECGWETSQLTFSTSPVGGGDAGQPAVPPLSKTTARIFTNIYWGHTNINISRHLNIGTSNTEIDLMAAGDKFCCWKAETSTII